MKRMYFAFYVLYLMPTVNYVKDFPLLNFVQYENVISFVRNFRQFCENFKDIRKIYL